MPMADDATRLVKIRGPARAMRFMAIITMAGLVAYFAWVSFAAGKVWVTHPLGATGLLDPDMDSFDYAHPWTMPVVEGPSVLLLFYGLLRLVRLMRLYEAGLVFDPQAASHLRVFAWCLFGSQVAEFGSETVLRLTMYILMPQIRPVPLRINTQELWSVFMSVLVLLLARVLSQAYLIAEENKQII
jgi:hypothetical protein